MEHESFEDGETAALMNERFVNVKVDREERPDVDARLHGRRGRAHGHGGWPMTVFLTPEGEPFLGGTYFPPEPRHGLPALPPGARRRLGRLPRAARRGRRAGAALTDAVAALGRARARRREPLTEAARPRRARTAQRLRRRVHGGWGDGAEVPARGDARVPAPRAEPTTRWRWSDDARRDGRGRHVRPRRRRLPPLLGRRRSGSSRTSRRCSTTTRSWPRRTSTRWV